MFSRLNRLLDRLRGRPRTRIIEVDEKRYRMYYGAGFNLRRDDSGKWHFIREYWRILDEIPPNTIITYEGEPMQWPIEATLTYA